MILKQGIRSTIEALFTSPMAQEETLISTMMMVDLPKLRSQDNSSTPQGCSLAWTWKSIEVPISTQSLYSIMRMDPAEIITSKLTMEDLVLKQTSIFQLNQDLLLRKVWEITSKFHFILREEVSWDRETTQYKIIFKLSKKQARSQLKTLCKQWLKNKVKYARTWMVETQGICCIRPKAISKEAPLLKKPGTIASITLQRPPQT